MKRKNKDKNGEYISVQNKDLVFLKNDIRSNDLYDVPKSVITLLKPFDINTIDYDSMNKYVDFYEKKQIEFFDKIHWIIDYDEYNNYSIEKLLLILSELEKRKSSYNLYICSDIKTIIHKKIKNTKKKKQSRIRKIIKNIITK